MLPLDEEMLADLIRWRKQTPNAAEEDWIFASPPPRNGPASPSMLPWHAFRHSLSTLLVAYGNDGETVQHLLRHANPSVTLGLYTGAVDEKSRKAQTQIVQQMLGRSAMGAGAVGNA